MPHKFLAVGAGLILAAGIGVAQKTEANRATGDNNFITKAAQGNMAEVEMGRLATQHATDAKVRQFGQRMVDDHSKANDELKKWRPVKALRCPRVWIPKIRPLSITFPS